MNTIFLFRMAQSSLIDRYQEVKKLLKKKDELYMRTTAVIEGVDDVDCIQNKHYGKNKSMQVKNYQQKKALFELSKAVNDLQKELNDIMIQIHYLMSIID